MAENSNNPKNLNLQNKGALNQHARRSSPSFDPRANQGKNRNNGAGQNVKNQFKRKLLTEGIKKGAQAYGVPESATQAILDSDTGKEAMDAAVNAPSIASGAKEAAGVIAKRELIKLLPAIVAPFLLILLFAAIIFSKDTFGGMGDGTDIYEDLRKEIAKTMQNYNGITDIDGTLILATLIGYSDVNELDEYSSSHSIAQMKSKVYDLATYQVMTTKACDYDSSTMRKIASNDDLFEEANYNCVADMEGESYKTSIEEGDYNDDNSGSVYYWNLIDEGFIFDYYNDYMIDPSEQYSSENDKKIEEIIAEIYAYYEALKEASEGNDYFSMYITGTGYWWPIGSVETTKENGKLFAKGEPSTVAISSRFGEIANIRNGKPHTGLDIHANGKGTNYHNIIASKSGIVISPSDFSKVQNKDSIYSGGKFIVKTSANTVIIDHGDNTYTLYTHLYGGSVLVKAGDMVEQGQVIAKMGSSGNSTGPHLHFEIREGGNTSDFAKDPELYVDPNNPRPTSTPFIEWIKNVEGGVSGKYVDGDNYVVYDGHDGVLTVGYGIVIVNKRGEQLYTNIYNTPVKEGSRIPISIVDKMFDQYMNGSRSVLAESKARNNIVLESYQDDAILSLMYNCGSGWGIRALNAYGSSKDEKALWNSMSQCKNAVIDGVKQEVYGLKLRRAEEYELFLKGDYEYNPLSYNAGNPVKYYDVSSW